MDIFFSKNAFRYLKAHEKMLSITMIGEMQIKTTRYSLTSLKMTIFQKIYKDYTLPRAWGTGNPPTPWAGM